MALVLILPVPFFVILWAIDNSPHSIFTFSRRRNRRNDQQPLILPKVCFTSTTLCERSSIPFSEQRFSFAFFFNSFNRCENCMVFGLSELLHSPCIWTPSAVFTPIIIPTGFISGFRYIFSVSCMLQILPIPAQKTVLIFIIR